jgi:hypothetical protein
VTLARINISDECIVALFRVKTVSELGTALALTSYCSLLRRIYCCMRTEIIAFDVLHDGWERELSF